MARNLPLIDGATLEPARGGIPTEGSGRVSGFHTAITARAARGSVLLRRDIDIECKACTPFARVTIKRSRADRNLQEACEKFSLES